MSPVVHLWHGSTVSASTTQLARNPSMEPPFDEVIQHTMELMFSSAEAAAVLLSPNDELTIMWHNGEFSRALGSGKHAKGSLVSRSYRALFPAGAAAVGAKEEWVCSPVLSSVLHLWTVLCQSHENTTSTYRPCSLGGEVIRALCNGPSFAMARCMHISSSFSCSVFRRQFCL